MVDAGKKEEQNQLKMQVSGEIIKGFEEKVGNQEKEIQMLKKYCEQLEKSWKNAVE